MLPGYSGILGQWLSRGGTYVLANIRGGGEYGPRWHTQAMRGNRHKVYEDFAAVARDLVERGITTAGQLGARGGGTNGGLLIGVMLTRYPELFGALVCSAPLLDLKRFHLLLDGRLWVEEYGDPDNPDDWAYMAEFSPCQNISADAHYPPLLMTTSMHERVHPAHARKMTLALEADGHPVYYYENIEGDHPGAANKAQAAFRFALEYSFLWRMLGEPTRWPPPKPWAKPSTTSTPGTPVSSRDTG
jgi:prolyl oligopeptidase